jgi:hypothetical protein
MLIIPNHVKWPIHESWGIKVKTLLNSILGFALSKGLLNLNNSCVRISQFVNH